MINIRLPNITAHTEREQLLQVKSYLHQLANDLNWALSSIESCSRSSAAAKQTSGNFANNGEQETSYNEMRSMIIKSASPVLLPRGQLGEGWNPDSIADGVHVFRTDYPLKDSSGNLIMYNGALIQMPASIDGSVLVQIALSVDSGIGPLYRLKWYSNWSDWVSFKI